MKEMLLSITKKLSVFVIVRLLHDFITKKTKTGFKIDVFPCICFCRRIIRITKFLFILFRLKDVLDLDRQDLGWTLTIFT
jgi:hypothetical protein